MLYFLYGALGVVLTLGLLAGGFVLGWKGRIKFTERAKVVAESQYTEQQVKQMEEDKVAFETMLRYNATTAYGQDRSTEELLKDDN